MKNKIGFLVGTALVLIVSLFIWQKSATPSDSALSTPPGSSEDTPSSFVPSSSATSSPVMNAASQSAFSDDLTPPLGDLTKDAPPGERTAAKVTIGKRERTMLPDQNGEFARVLIEPQGTIAVQISFPEGEAGQPVAVEVEDGGVLDGKDRGKALTLDEAKNIRFTFRANADPGLYHVLVRKGPDSRLLNFWVGPELPVANR